MAGPLSNVDAAWLRMEDPTNLMMVTGVLVFEEPLDPRKVRSLLEKRLLAFDRFRQRVVEAPLGIGPARWVEDRRFDLDAHRHRMALPAPGDRAALETLVGDLMSAPLDISKPLWQIHLIEGYGRGSVFLARIHHCIADGIALIQVLLSLTDSSPRPGRVVPLKRTTGSHGSNPLAAPLGALATLLANPIGLVELAQEGVSLADTLQRLVLLPPDPKTVLKGRLGVSKRAAWSEMFPLEKIRAAASRHRATINDILITAVAGALREYLEERGEPVDELVIRAAVPVNLRPIERGLEMGNSFGLVFVPLPISTAGPFERLAQLKLGMDRIKASSEAIVSFGVLNAIGVVPRQLHPPAIEFFGSKASVVMTNLPGPREPLYLAGRRIANCMFWVPLSGHLGLGISILSYAGNVMVGVAADAGLVPDPGRIVGAFGRELNGLMMPASRRSGGKVSERKRPLSSSDRPRKRARAARGPASPGG
ncbi:MAG TPA: wax ester/triacylglycerol synthase family O-acyltransferase [Solirubrobacterales bacterium]|nr:wax ester/triacylglycerol synthase family O-acyltransferase [Solirubrobacterales bacterium]